jgi:hypothetical protein
VRFCVRRDPRPDARGAGLGRVRTVSGRSAERAAERGVAADRDGADCVAPGDGRQRGRGTEPRRTRRQGDARHAGSGHGVDLDPERSSAVADANGGH